MILELIKKNIFYILLFVAVFFVHSYWIFNIDEGVILAGAWDLYNGKKIYIDFFSYISPLSFYFIFIIWKFFGVSYLVAKFFSIIVFYFVLIGIYKISNFFINYKFSFFSSLFYLYLSIHWPLINHNLFSIFFIIWALYFFLKSFDENIIRNIIYSSSLLGLSVLFLQHRGGILIVGILFYLIVLYFYKKNKSILRKFSYFLIFSLFFTSLLFIFWPVSIIFNSLIVYPFLNYSEVNIVSPFFLILAILGTCFLYVLLREKNEKIYFLFLVQALLLLTVVPMRDLVHVLMISFINIIFLAALLEKLLKHVTRESYSKIIFYLFIAAIVIFAIVSTLEKVFTQGGINSKNLYIKEIRARCQDSNYIYSGPFFPNIYSESKMLNPSPYSYLITGHQTEEDFLKAMGSLKKHKPSCAILGYKAVERFGYDKNNYLDNYIFENYHFEKKLDYNTVLYKINLLK